MQKRAHEVRDILKAGSQRRKVNLQDCEPIVKIRAEDAVTRFLPQIVVRSTDDSHVVTRGGVAAHRHYVTSLEQSQQPRLKIQGEIPDLIKEERAAIGSRERPDSGGDRARKRTAYMPEQVTFYEPSVNAPQSNTTNGLSRRSDSEWIARAASSFPVPVSPSTSTGASLRLAASNTA